MSERDGLGGLKPKGCTCGEMCVGGINGPSRRVMSIDANCPWHRGIREREEELRAEKRKVTDPAILKIVCALIGTSAYVPSEEDDWEEGLVQCAHDILRAIREYKR